MLEDCLVMTDIMKLTSVHAENNNKNVIDCMMHHTPPSSMILSTNICANDTPLQQTIPSKLDLHMLNIPIWNYDDFVLEYLSEGYFGNVYKAKHVPTNELLVLKIIKDEEEEEHCQSFIQEVCLLCRLSHQNVLKIKGITFQDGQLCCLSEYIDGGCLQDFLYNDNELTRSWLMFLNLTLDVSRGMYYLHGQGVIHRDLNSKNILLREIRKDRFEAVIIDFGLSYQQPDLSINGDETPSGPAGSPFHIAPELFNGQYCSRKTDVFAFGIILCEMISGCPGAYPEELPRSDDYGLNVEEFSEMVSDCPAEFLNLAVRCCQVKPEHRPHFSDIMKIVDIIIDRCIEQSFENIEKVVITPREHVISISGTGHDEYILDHCLLCSCGDSSADEDGNDDKLGLSGRIKNIGFKETFDRFGGVLRTGSRRLMRKYFKRCSVCGGRVLDLDGDLQEDESEACSYDNPSTLPLVDIEEDFHVNKQTDLKTLERCVKDEPPPSMPINDFASPTDLTILQCEEEQQNSVGHDTPPENFILEQHRTRSPPQKIPEVKVDTDSLSSESDSIPSDYPVSPRWNTLERVPKHQAGSLLRHMNSDISTRTSQMAQYTPGRLPRFFSYIMRRRKGAHHLNKDTERRGSRMSLHKFFNLKSADASVTSGSKNLLPHTPDLSTVPSPGSYHGRRRFTFSKHKFDKEEYDKRRLSMPIAAVRNCVSGPSSPDRELPPPSVLTSKSLKSLSDLDMEDGRQLKTNSTHKRYSSHYKSGLNSSKKHSRSLVDLLFRKKNTHS